MNADLVTSSDMRLAVPSLHLMFWFMLYYFVFFGKIDRIDQKRNVKPQTLIPSCSSSVSEARLSNVSVLFRFWKM